MMSEETRPSRSTEKRYRGCRVLPSVQRRLSSVFVCLHDFSCKFSLEIRLLQLIWKCSDPGLREHSGI